MKALPIVRAALPLLVVALLGSPPVGEQTPTTVLASQPVSQATVPQWVDLEGPNGPMRAAVFRPSASGAFPVLVVLHPLGGVSQQFLDWASRFANDGYGVLVGCYMRHSGQAVVRCPALPSAVDPRLRAEEAVTVLIDAARKVPGARPERIGLIGWSWSANLATAVASSGARVQALVAIAGQYSPLDGLVTGLQAPVLLLHGKRDETNNVEQAIAYEAALRAAGKSVEIFLYDNGSHLLPFDPATADDVYRRTVGFFNRYLRP